jgi:hypothetical protein
MICRREVIRLSIGFCVAWVTASSVMAVIFVFVPSALPLLSCVYLCIGLKVDGAIQNESLAALSPRLDARHVALLIAEFRRSCFSCAVLGVRVFVAQWLNSFC